LDETTLQSVAQTGNGKYYRAAADGRELDSLLAEIDDLQRAQLQTRFETTYIERFQIFLALALAALIAAELIPDRKSTVNNEQRTVNRKQSTVASPQSG
jgi:hypothetical protein